MQHVKYEVWILVKKELCLDEVIVESFSRLGAACSFAETLTCLINVGTVKKVIVYCNEDGFRRKITSFDVKCN